MQKIITLNFALNLKSVSLQNEFTKNTQSLLLEAQKTAYLGIFIHRSE